MNDRFRELADGYIEDTLDPSQLTELENFLLDETARLEFLTYLEVHSSLAWESRRSAPFKFRAEPKILVVDFSRKWLAAAALIALLLVATFFLIRKPATENSSVATIKASLHGQWADGGQVIAGSKIEPGIWELQTGLVELETQPGTILLLEGPASIEIKDRLNARLISGNLVVRMPKGQSGFVVEMPRMKVTDLGTEFGVSVSSSGESRVQVYDGKVRAETDESPGRELIAGETVLCSFDGAMKPTRFDEDRFIRKFPPPVPGYQAGGPLYNRSTIHSVDVTTAPDHVMIDGDLSEWNAAGTFFTSCEPPYHTTYFVEGRMMYDAENLYLAGRVGDPEPMKNAARPGMEFAGGSVIVRLSADRSLGWPLKGTTDNARSKSPLPDSVNTKISNIILWHDSKTNRARVRIAHAFDSRDITEDPSGWSGAFTRHPDHLGYTFEVKIPWSALNCADDPPRAGDSLAGLWMAHWSDSEGRVCRGQLVDVTNPDPSVSSRIAPFVFFQNGPCWGRMNYLPIAE